MLKDYSWKAFEFTGKIDAYILYKEIEKNLNYFGQKQIEISKEEVAASS